jgi:hypothetical protein
MPVLYLTLKELSLLSSQNTAKVNDISPVNFLDEACNINKKEEESMKKDFIKKGFINEISIDNKLLDPGIDHLISSLKTPDRVITFSKDSKSISQKIFICIKGNISYVYDNDMDRGFEVLLYPLLKNDVIDWLGEEYMDSNIFGDVSYKEWEQLLDIDELVILMKTIEAINIKTSDDKAFSGKIEYSDINRDNIHDITEITGQVIEKEWIEALLKDKNTVEYIVQKLQKKAFLIKEEEKIFLSEHSEDIFIKETINESFTIKDCKLKECNYKKVYRTDKGFIVIKAASKSCNISITTVPYTMPKEQLFEFLIEDYPIAKPE